MSRYGYVPFMLVGLNGVGTAISAASAPKYWLLAVLAVAIATTFLVERIIPYDATWNRDRADSTRDRIHVAVNETLILAGVAAIPLLAAVVPAPQLWPHNWPFIAQVLAAILIADLGITVVHLASHKVGVLWRFHAVHHSITRFYGLNGLMKHPLHQTVEMAAGVAPLILVGLPVDVASVLALAVAIQLLLQHSNADYRIGPAKHVLALNECHRFHHLKWAGIGDVNFGLFTLVWDHLLRTYSYDCTRHFLLRLHAALRLHPARHGRQTQLPHQLSAADDLPVHARRGLQPRVLDHGHDGRRQRADTAIGPKLQSSIARGPRHFPGQGRANRRSPRRGPRQRQPGPPLSAGIKQTAPVSTHQGTSTFAPALSNLHRKTKKAKRRMSTLKGIPVNGAASPVTGPWRRTRRCRAR